MIPPHAVQVSDEEAEVLGEALSFFLAEWSYRDGLIETRFRAVAKELALRLPVSLAKAA